MEMKDEKPENRNGGKTLRFVINPGPTLGLHLQGMQGSEAKRP